MGLGVHACRGLGRGVRAPHAVVCALAALRRLLCDAWHMFGELRAVMVCVHKKRQQNDYIRLFTVHQCTHIRPITWRCSLCV